MTIESVLSGSQRWHCEQADCLDFLRRLPDDSVNLCVFSPPYEDRRTYGIDFRLKGQAWVDWMVQVFTECRRVCVGLVACVCEGKTRGFRYSCTPALLMADLHRAGFNLRKPPIFHRVGIPGSGGPDWLRSDTEFIVCTTRPGKLPWADPTACGHAPKWAPGGEMSYRSTDGTRRNQWGGGEKSGGTTRKNGERQKAGRPSHNLGSEAEAKVKKRRSTRGCKDGDTQDLDGYTPPVKANPGNSIERTYTAQEVAELLAAYENGDWRHFKVGGGLMGGDEYSSQNEAPYPEKLCELFILSFCPPGGTVCDPFSGSGTTGVIAIRNQRWFLGCDVRESQVELTRKRLSEETPLMFV